MNKKINWIAVAARSIIGLVCLMLLGFAIFGKRTPGIDKVNLADRITWAPWDIIGLLLFLAGAIWIAGLADVVHKLFTQRSSNLYLYGSKGEEWKGVGIGAGLVILGFILFWV